MVGRRGQDDSYTPSRPEAIAEHPYTKLSIVPIIIFVLSVFGWFGNYLIGNIEKKIDLQYQAQQSGLAQINANVTGIAVNRYKIDDIEDDIVSIDLVNVRQWSLINAKADK